MAEVDREFLMEEEAQGLTDGTTADVGVLWGGLRNAIDGSPLGLRCYMRKVGSRSGATRLGPPRGSQAPLGSQATGGSGVA